MLREPRRPAAKAETPPAIYTVFLFWLGGIILAAAGIVLGIGLAGWWGLATGLGGLLLGFLAFVAGTLGISTQPTEKSRFNVVTLAGLLIPLTGLALGWHLGGLIGAGVGLSLLGLGALVLGIGIAVGVPDPSVPPRVK